jgi:chromosomal replication initiation ATPase DnaA
MYVAVNSGLAAEILGSKYQTMLDESVQEATGTNFKLVFIEKAKITQTNEIKPSAPTFFADAALNSAYTFKTFVVGPSNREAYQASLMVARNPGQLYNPLLIFSDSGLGKTHLLHAIGNSIKESHPTARVLYVTAADFVDEYIKYAHGEKEGDSLQTFFKIRSTSSWSMIFSSSWENGAPWRCSSLFSALW